MMGLRVLDDVVQRFLCDPIETECDRRVEGREVSLRVALDGERL